MSRRKRRLICRMPPAPLPGTPPSKIWRGFASTSWISCLVIEAARKNHEGSIWLRLEQSEGHAILALAAHRAPHVLPAHVHGAERVFSAAVAAHGDYRESGRDAAG